MGFSEALVSEKRNNMIPLDDDWFGSLVGEWDFDWIYDINGDNYKVQKGEWIFSRVLNGTAIQDLFIVPSRAERKRLNMPDAEYGTTIRMYNPETREWEAYYTCIGEYTRLTARKTGDKIELTEKNKGRMKWVFSEMTQDSFHWQNIVLNENGQWELCCDCRAVRHK